MQDCGSPLVLRLCALGYGTAFVYDELYTESNDVKGQTLIYMTNCCRAGIEFNRLYTIYLFEGTFLKSIKQNLMLCI